ncbi:hypothetical protein [Devosia riboflavina]
MSNINYNHRHQPSGEMTTSTTGELTIGDLRDAIANMPDDAKLVVAPCDCGIILKPFGFKVKTDKEGGPTHLIIQQSEMEAD